MDQQKVKVVNVLGYERSGTTLLHNILGQTENSFAAGELAEIWRLRKNLEKPCGCGELLRGCPVWTEVFCELNVRFPGISQERLANTRKRIQNRNLINLWISKKQLLADNDIQYYLKALEDLYLSISNTTNAQFIVDTSKVPFYNYLLSKSDKLDLYTIHLVRAPHAVEYSLLKRKLQGHQNYLNHSTFKGVSSWIFLNSMIEMFQDKQRARYLRIRFEDFINEPKIISKNIFDFLEYSKSPVFDAQDGKVFLTPTHSVTGSPSRFNTGMVPLKLDETWKKEMPIINQALVSGLTLPVMWKYKCLF